MNQQVLSEERIKCDKCGHDATYFQPKWHYNHGKRCDGIFRKTTVYHTYPVLKAVLKALIEQADKNDNDRLNLLNTVMYALKAQSSEDPIVQFFWDEFREENNDDKKEE